MKIIYDKEILQIASAGLRCGRWAIKHKKDQDKIKIGWHAGKSYAYLWTMIHFGIVQEAKPSEVLDWEDYKHHKYSGKIHLFPTLFEVNLFMDKKYFNYVLESNQPHQGKGIVRDIRRMCPEIK